MTEPKPFLPGLSPVAGKSFTAAQDAGNLTSNGGLIVLRERANRLGVAAIVADPLPDTRNPLLVVHSYRAMLTARMMAIAAGYEDADDLDALRHDPALLIACDRAPESGHGIPSQPTISRLENVARVKALYRIGIGYIDLFCRGYATPPHAIVLDIDDTDDLVHGGQQLALFNTHAGGHMLPAHPHLRGKLRQADLVAAATRQAAVGGRDRARALACDSSYPPALARRAPSDPWRRALLRAGSAECAAPIELRLHPRAAGQRQPCRACRTLARAVPMAMEAAPFEGAPLPSGPACGGLVGAIGEDHRARRGDGHGNRRALRRHQSAGPGQDPLREGLLRARAHGEPDQGHEAHHALGQDGMLALGGEPVPPLPAHHGEVVQCTDGGYWLLHSVRLAAPRRSRWRGATFETIRAVFVKIGCRVEELRTRIKLSFPAHLPHAGLLNAIAARLCAQGP
jgi:hypothetical protein